MKGTPIFLYTTLELHWGFIVRQPGASAAQSAYPLPPPTTVVGAFAAQLGRLIGEHDAITTTKRRSKTITRLMDCALRSTITAAAGLLRGGVAVAEEPSRILAAPYKGSSEISRAVNATVVDGVSRLLAVQAVGIASAPSAQLVLAWAFDMDELDKCIGKTLSRRDLEKVVASVYRVGSKEGIASVVPHRSTRVPGQGVLGPEDLDLIDRGTFRSVLYQPANCVRQRSGGVARITLLDKTYNEALYVVPGGPASGAGILLGTTRPAMFELRYGACRALVPREKDLALGMAYL